MSDSEAPAAAPDNVPESAPPKRKRGGRRPVRRSLPGPLYLDHFGLSEAPFGITPDTDFIFGTSAHQEGFNTLLIALKSGEGFVKITGEVGTGKTLLCRRLLQALADDCITAYLPNPALTPQTLLRSVADELRLALPPGDDAYALLKALNEALLDSARQARPVVILIDEAQAIPLESLEALRLLSNLETEKRKLVQIVLFGQPELDRRLADPAIRQLRQRIAFSHRIGGMSRAELRAYLSHRMRQAGLAAGEVFSDEAVADIYRASRGTPRLVNILANKCLLAVFGEGQQMVRRSHVRAAARDTEGAYRPLLWWWGKS